MTDEKIIYKPTPICPTCNIVMLKCQHYGGGVYWICTKCAFSVESTGV